MMWFYIVSSKWNKNYSLYVLFKDGDYYKAVGIKNERNNRKLMTAYKIIEKIDSNLIYHFSKISPDSLIVCDDMKKFMHVNKILFENENIYYYREVNFSSTTENILIQILLDHIEIFNMGFKINI